MPSACAHDPSWACCTADVSIALEGTSELLLPLHCLDSPERGPLLVRIRVQQSPTGSASPAPTGQLPNPLHGLPHASAQHSSALLLCHRLGALPHGSSHCLVHPAAAMLTSDASCACLCHPRRLPCQRQRQVLQVTLATHDGGGSVLQPHQHRCWPSAECRQVLQAMEVISLFASMHILEKCLHHAYLRMI